MIRAALAVVVAAALAGGCSKKAAPPPTADPGADRPPPITVDEKTRNADACTDYVAKICACAKAHPDKVEVGELCTSDTPLPDALALSMLTAENPASTRNDVILAQGQARKIATSCLDQLAKLPTLGCE